MNVEVELPDMGADSDHATVSNWRYEEGEFVEAGDILLEVVCEMETVQVPSPCSGVLVERVVDEDEVVRVGELLAIIEPAREEAAEETEAEPDEE